MTTPNRIVCSLFCLALFLASCDSTDPNVQDDDEHAPAQQVSATIKPGENHQPISPYIYGSNQELSDNDAWTVRRIGGNRLTGYNWENDYSNAGSDWMHSSDTWLLTIFGLAPTGNDPGRVMTTFHDESRAMGAESIITLQMAGYVSADQNGNVSENQTAPSSRWKRVQLVKGDAFTTSPDRTDDVVYMDEFVNFMVDRYGPASAPGGVKWYSLDNEPGLWSHTHPRIHPNPVGAAELVERSIETALAVKAVDPDAKIVGPALFGFSAFENLQGAPDWDQERTGRWFIDYYLDKMQEAEQTHGIRLLDVLDIHWYPEARGDNRIVFEGGSVSTKDVEARLQAPRTLWDASYIEDSWIGEWKQDFLPLLPSIQASIDTYYPNTKLGITEYNYGATNAISGGLAQVDVLGVFGTSNIHLATLWKLSDDENRYARTAFDLYRNYDGQQSTYGDTSVGVELADKVNFSVYAAIHGDDESQVHIIAINKHRSDAAEFSFTLDGTASYSDADVWYFNQGSSLLQQAPAQTVSGNSLTYTVPAMTAIHAVIR